MKPESNLKAPLCPLPSWIICTASFMCSRHHRTPVILLFRSMCPGFFFFRRKFVSSPDTILRNILLLTLNRDIMMNWWNLMEFLSLEPDSYGIPPRCSGFKCPPFPLRIVQRHLKSHGHCLYTWCYHAIPCYIYKAIENAALLHSINFPQINYTFWNFLQIFSFLQFELYIEFCFLK